MDVKLTEASTARACKGRRKDGLPCGGFAINESGYCFAHDPTKGAERRAARAKGGRARHGRNVRSEPRTVNIETIADLLALLNLAANDLLMLENSISRGRALLAAVVAGVKVLEVGELEKRVEAIERALKERQDEH